MATISPRDKKSILLGGLNTDNTWYWYNPEGDINKIWYGYGLEGGREGSMTFDVFSNALMGEDTRGGSQARKIASTRKSSWWNSDQETFNTLMASSFQRNFPLMKGSETLLNYWRGTGSTTWWDSDRAANLLNSQIPSVPAYHRSDNSKTPAEDTNVDTSGTDFWTNSPFAKAITDYLNWALPNIQKVTEAASAPYPGGVKITQPAEEKQIISRLQERAFGGKGFASVWKQAYDRQLPTLMHEQKIERASSLDQLERLGIAGSTPGQTILNEQGAGFARDRALLAHQSELEALQGETSDIGYLSEAVGRREERDRRNIEAGYQDFLRESGLPSMVSLGSPMATTGLSQAGQLYSTGATLANQLEQTKLGANATVSAASKAANASMYATDQATALAKWEAQFMAPYLSKAGQAVSYPSPGCCVIASVTNGDRNAYPVQICRVYRDRYMDRAGLLGYYRFAEVVVPLMLKYRAAMSAARWLVARLVRTGEGILTIKSRAGIFDRAVTAFFLKTWKVIGILKPNFVRSNGETVDDSISRHVGRLATRVYRHLKSEKRWRHSVIPLGPSAAISRQSGKKEN